MPFFAPLFDDAHGGLTRPDPTLHLVGRISGRDGCRRAREGSTDDGKQDPLSLGEREKLLARWIKPDVRGAFRLGPKAHNSESASRAMFCSVRVANGRRFHSAASNRRLWAK